LLNDIDTLRALIASARADHAAVASARNVTRRARPTGGSYADEAITAEIRRAHFGRQSERILDALAPQEHEPT
jgi:hypothetical protein